MLEMQHFIQVLRKFQEGGLILSLLAEQNKKHFIKHPIIAFLKSYFKMIYLVAAKIKNSAIVIRTLAWPVLN